MIRISAMQDQRPSALLSLVHRYTTPLVPEVKLLTCKNHERGSTDIDIQIVVNLNNLSK